MALGLGNGIPSGSARDILLVSYTDSIYDPASSSSVDGWSGYSIDQGSVIINASATAGNTNLVAFSATQTDDAGVERAFITDNGIAGDYLEITFGIAVGAANDKWGAGDGDPVPVTVKCLGVESTSNVSINDLNTLTTITTKLTATGSYSSATDKKIIIYFKASNSELPQENAAVRFGSISAQLYRAI